MHTLDDVLSSIGISLPSTNNMAEEPSNVSSESVSQEQNNQENNEEEASISIVPVEHEENTTPLNDDDFFDILQEHQIDMFENPDGQEGETNTTNEEVVNEETETPPFEMTITTEDDEIDNSQNTDDSPSIDLTVLPANSPTLLVNEATSRFSGAAWYSEIQKQNVLIAGIGGIGSNLAFQIARMTPASITLYDDDTVETVNMSGQLFSCSDIGAYKVDAIATMITNYTTAHNIYSIRRKYESVAATSDIMMCGFDNMLARKVFFAKWRDHVINKEREERKKCLFLDGRLSIDTLQVLCIRGDDAYNINRYYKEFLFTDSMADATVCSTKQTTYMACMIASIMVNMFTNFVANSLDPIIPFNLPFFTEYDAQNMIFRIQQ